MKSLKIAAISLLAGLSLANVSNADEPAAPAKYQSACFACHGSGAAGSPKAGDKEAWAPRVEKGLDALLASVKGGKNAMPPGGLCADCSDAEYQELIEFMSGHKF